MKQFLTYIISFCFMFFSSCSSNKAQNDNSNADEQELEAFLSELIKEEEIPGAIAAIFDSNGQVLMQSAGVRHVDSAQQILSTDKFHIGSCTKSMTSTLIQILISREQLNWNTTIADVFPEAKDSIHQEYHDITIHELVMHRSGIAQNALDYAAYPESDTINRRLKIFLENSQTPLPFKRGTFNYSNFGYLIAGCVLERIMGQSWESLMKEYLFKPLEMKSAGFGAPGTPGKIDQPWGHDFYVGEQIVETLQSKQLDNPLTIGPAGTVHCNFEDWSKYASIFLTTDNELISNQDIDNLVRPVGNYACGWFVENRGWANGLTFSHSGSNTMWYTSIWIAPNIDRVFMAGINYGGENDRAICERITERLIDIYLDEPR